MARAGLQWSINDLRDAAGVGRMTVARFERGDQVQADSVEKMRSALVGAGASFCNEGRWRGAVSVKP